MQSALFICSMILTANMTFAQLVDLNALIPVIYTTELLREVKAEKIEVSYRYGITKANYTYHIDSLGIPIMKIEKEYSDTTFYRLSECNERQHLYGLCDTYRGKLICNDLGQLVSAECQAFRITATYDLLGHIISKNKLDFPVESAANAYNENFTYNALGLPIKDSTTYGLATDEGVIFKLSGLYVTNYVYDEKGRLLFDGFHKYVYKRANYCRVYANYPDEETLTEKVVATIKVKARK